MKRDRLRLFSEMYAYGADCKPILPAFVPARRFFRLEGLLSVALLRLKHFKTAKSLRPPTKS